MRELLQNRRIGLTPLGFIDDDRRKRRLTIDGLAVLGELGDLEQILDEHRRPVAAVVVAISDLPRRSSTTSVRCCASAASPFAACASRWTRVRRRPGTTSAWWVSQARRLQWSLT